jgi:hypothetical protein
MEGQQQCSYGAVAKRRPTEAHAKILGQEQGDRPRSEEARAGVTPPVIPCLSSHMEHERGEREAHVSSIPLVVIWLSLLLSYYRIFPLLCLRNRW